MESTAQEFGLPENVEVLDILISVTHPDRAILIAGEDYEENAKQPIIRIYLAELVEDQWANLDELEAFAFGGYREAQRFHDNLPSMSAIDLLLMMNSHNPHIFNGEYIQ